MSEPVRITPTEVIVGKVHDADTGQLALEIKQDGSVVIHPGYDESKHSGTLRAIQLGMLKFS